MTLALAACGHSNRQAITQIEVERDASGAGNGRIVSLPLFTRSRRSADSIYWYRIPASTYKTLENPAVLISRAATNFQLYLDDEWAHGGSFEASPMRYTMNTPFLVPLSKNTLADATYIKIAMYALAGNHVFLEPLYIGEYEDLTGLHQLLSLLQNKFSFALTVAALCLAVVSMLLWLSSHGERHYLLGLLTAIALIAANFNFFVLNPLLEQKSWQVLAHTSLDWFCVFAIQWMAALKCIEHWVIQKLWLWGLFSTTINLLLPLNYMVPTVEILHAVSIVLFLYSMVLAQRAENTDHIEKLFILFVSVSGILMCLTDLLVQFGVFYLAGLPRGTPLTFFLVLLFNNVILLRRFSQTYKDAQRSNEKLAAMVQEKEIELGSQYQQLTQLQTERARVSERQLIFRDLHDGMGGHLVSAIALSRNNSPNNQVLSALQSAHDDMRLLIDGNSLQDADLAETLGQIRHQLQRQASTARLQFEWKMQPMTDIPIKSVQKRMHIVRIIQESVTNVIKHANANKLVISISVADGHIEISIIDNGIGNNKIAHIDKSLSGNGLKNMHYRAEQLGGVYRLQSTASGSVALLRLPLALDLINPTALRRALPDNV